MRDYTVLTVFLDLISKRRFGLVDRPWNELLNPLLLGPLADEAIQQATNSARCELLIRLPRPSNAKVTIKHGLVAGANKTDLDYRLDADFFEEETTNVESALDVLAQFNATARDFFQWAIRPPLHDAMGPVEPTRHE